jgi:hypothetical protein
VDKITEKEFKRMIIKDYQHKGRIPSECKKIS